MFGTMHKYEYYDENKVYITIDNARQENTCRNCGHSCLGATPDKCFSCGVMFKKPNK